MGLVALPSSETAKVPAIGDWGRFRTQPVPDLVYDSERWVTRNMQVMCGVRTSGKLKVIVVDCDGEQGRDAWKNLWRIKKSKPEPTWVSATGGGGRHWWYRLPPSIEVVPSRPIWGLWNPWGGPKGLGEWCKHLEVRIIGDGGLAIAPPSIHIGTGHEYEWAAGCGPANLSLPALAPDWLLYMPARTTQSRNDYQTAGNKKYSTHSNSPRDAILQAISPTEKIRLAASWGLRLCELRGNQQLCRAIDRDDTNRSCVLNADSGVYHDFTTNTSLSFFDLAVRLGAYPNFGAAVEGLSRNGSVAFK
jgi:hypothetical protein